MKRKTAITYRRVLIKLSGEALGGKGVETDAYDPSVCRTIAKEIAAIRKLGVQIGIVIGGGNILRGGSARGILRVSADAMGMLATVINSIAMRDFLEEAGCPVRVFTSVAIEGIGDRFSAHKARASLAAGTVVIIAGGTGNPFFTTDTAAALRCAEIGADVLIKATKVDGVYDRDPVKYPGAKKFPRLTHADALARNLRVMDATAFSFCMENAIPIVVLQLFKPGNMYNCITGRQVGSIVTTGGG